MSISGHRSIQSGSNPLYRPQNPPSPFKRLSMAAQTGLSLYQNGLKASSKPKGFFQRLTESMVGAILLPILKPSRQKRLLKSHINQRLLEQKKDGVAAGKHGSAILSPAEFLKLPNSIQQTLLKNLKDVAASDPEQAAELLRTKFIFDRAKRALAKLAKH